MTREPADRDLDRTAESGDLELVRRLGAVSAVGRELAASSPVTSRSPADPENPVSQRMLTGLVTSSPSTGLAPGSPPRRSARGTAQRRSATSRGGSGGRDRAHARSDEQRGHRPDRERVPEGSEPGDAAVRDRCDRRGVAERLAGGGIRQVQLDDDPVEGSERVVQRPGGVGERARVDDDRPGTSTCGVDRLDEFAFVVRLHVVELIPVCRRRLLAAASTCSFELGTSRRPPVRARRAGRGSAPTGGGWSHCPVTAVRRSTRRSISERVASTSRRSMPWTDLDAVADRRARR